jgi:uncharacterized protein involved in exopolysaccharide biosynthesis
MGTTMDRVATLPAASPVEGLLITFFANRRKLLWVPALIFAAAVLIALVTPARYVIESEVLVTLGSEYNYRPPAGEQAGVSQALDRDHTMHTEALIMGSPDLHRDTLRIVGLDRLYPKYLHPGLLSRTVSGLKDGVGEALAALGLAGPPAPKADPLEFALKEFEAALTFDVPKNGSVITVTFRHKDAEIGAEALNTMLALYIERRGALYRDDQSEIVARQVAVTKAALSDADAKLAAFRLSHQVGGFEARRDILLKRRGELETDRTDAQSQAAQLSARLAGVTRQLAQVPQNVTSAREVDSEARLSPGRTSMEQLRAEYAHALTQYRPDAPLVTALRAQIEAREGDLAATRGDRTATMVRTAQNPAWLDLESDRLKSETGLAVQRARLAQDDAHLGELGAEIAALDASEQELSELELQQTLAQSTYSSATKTLEDRRVIDEVERAKRPTARILQPAVPPVSPSPLRKLVVAAGALLALLGLAGATLVAHAFGRTYWRPEALESDFGIAVIAVVRQLPPAPGARRAAQPG